MQWTRRSGERGGRLKTELLAEFQQIKDRHWWYRGRRVVLRAVLQATLPPDTQGPLLDVGSGPATNRGLLSALGFPIVALDTALAALRPCRSDGYGRPVVGDAGVLPFGDASFGMVAALDILEHLDDDAAAIAELHRVLRPGGIALIAVPAFPSLWGWQDEVSGHRRRYAPPVVQARLREGGLQLIKTTCMNSALALPVWCARRLLRWSGRRPRSENTLTPTWMDPLLYAIFVAEAPLAARWRLPYGTSIVCVARRA